MGQGSGDSDIITKINALLLKHARTSTSARGEKIYNAKRTVHSQ